MVESAVHGMVVLEEASSCKVLHSLPIDIRALPTETKVESGTSQSKSGTSVNLVTVENNPWPSSQVAVGIVVRMANKWASGPEAIPGFRAFLLPLVARAIFQV